MQYISVQSDFFVSTTQAETHHPCILNLDKSFLFQPICFVVCQFISISFLFLFFVAVSFIDSGEKKMLIIGVA